MAYLYFESFVVSIKGTAKRLEEMSPVMTVRKRINRFFAKMLTAASCVQIKMGVYLTVTVIFLQVVLGCIPGQL